MNIRHRLYALVAATALPLVGVAAFHVYSDVREITKREEQVSSTIAEQTARYIAHALDSSRQAMETVARQHRERLIHDAAHCRAVTALLLASNPLYLNVTVRDRHDAPVCSGAPRKLPAVSPEVDSFRQALRENRFVIGKPYVAPQIKQWIVQLRQPIRDDSGQPIGILSIPVDLVNLQPLVNAGTLPAGGVTVVIAADGTIVARSSDSEKWVGKNVGALAAAAYALQTRQGNVTGRGMDGIERVYGFITIESAGWTVASGIPTDLVYGGVYRAATIDVVSMLLVLLMATGLAWAIGRSIASPVRRLADTVNTVAAGGTSARAPVAGPKEVAEVAQQLNVMLDAREEAEAKLREQEERYRSLIELSPDAIYINQGGLIRFANGACAQLLRAATASELAGRSVLDTIHPDYRREVSEAMRTLESHGGRMLSLERKWLRLDGVPVDVEVSIAAIDYEKKPAILVIARDVTARKRAETERAALEQSLRVSERRQAHILRAMPIVLYTANADGEFGATWISENAEAVSGYPPSRFTAEASFWASRIHSGDVDRVFTALERLGAGDAIEIEYRWQCADGEYRWFNDRATLIRNEDGSPREIIGSWLDVTERKRTEQKMREQLEELQRWYRAMLDREDRVRALKHEVNELLESRGEPARYAKRESA